MSDITRSNLCKNCTGSNLGIVDMALAGVDLD
jgi:hypothetical protein